MKYKLEALKILCKHFNEYNIKYCIGASTMLYFRGIVDNFNDIDIMIDEKDSNKVIKIFDSYNLKSHEVNNSKYKTKVFLEYNFMGVEIDIIGGFIIIKDGIDYDCSINEESLNDHIFMDGVRIPIDSLNNWKHYYYLMGRDNKVELINNYGNSCK